MSIKMDTSIAKTNQDLLMCVSHAITHPIKQAVEDFFLFPRSSKASQILLLMKYKEIMACHLPLPTFDDVQFRAYSQFGEDGILLYLFALLGCTNKKCVEICGGGGYDNTSNLIINHGWNGLFFDGSAQRIQRGRRFYARCADTRMWPPRLIHAWITDENINTLLEQHGYTGEIDLLSLDMDGIDYWIWKTITCIKPRVVVLEYNHLLGPDLSLTIPNKPDFVMTNNAISTTQYQMKKVIGFLAGKKIEERIDSYYGASLRAFTRLGKQLGYRLVGCERYGFNAFFVRSDLAPGLLPQVSIETCFTHPYTQHTMVAHKQQLLEKAWIEV